MSRYKKCRNQCEAGFTLIELLVVIAMIGIIAAISAPSWLGLLNRQRQNAIRTDLLGVLQTAQIEAKSRQQSKQVTFSSTALSVTVRDHYDNTGNVATSGGIITVLGSGDVRSDFQLTAPSTSIVFDHDGRVSADLPFAIKVVDDNTSTQSCVIVTTLLGGLKPANNDMCDDFVADPVGSPKSTK